MHKKINGTLGRALLLTLLAGAGMGALAPARAEKADSFKQTEIAAKNGSFDNVKRTGLWNGDVVLTKGTLIMKSGRALVTEDPQGYKFVTLWAAAGQLATFRQKRDGGDDLWMEGEAERIEYNDKTEIVKLYSKAKVTQLEGKRPTSEAEGPFISYDSRSEVYAVENSVSGDSTPGGGRVKMIMQARPAAGAAPAKPATAAPASAPASAPAPAVKP
jgi:lipopolysaccharide export system protein LptA